MTGDSIVAAAALIAATAILAIVVFRLGRDTALGLAHPAAVWAALTVIFFAIGSLVLAAQARPGPAAYTAGAIGAVAIGLVASAQLARHRGAGPMVATRGRPTDGGGVRLPVVVGLAGLGLAALAPTLLRTGLPFLVEDITGARIEVAGLEVQLPRVTLPALAAITLLVALRRPSRATLAVTVTTIAAIGVFDVLLASRYLVAELAAVLVLSWFLAGRRIPAGVVIAGVIGAIGLFAGIQIARTWDQAADEPFAFVAARTIDRILLIGPRTLDALMTVIPAEQDHFGGLTWVRRLAPFVGRDDVPNLGYWIFPRVIPGGTGYAAPGWLGEAWANLGWAGLGLFALLGVVIERVGALIGARRGQDVDIVAGALLVLFIARTHALGLVGVGVLAVLVAAWRVAAGPGDGLLRDLAAIVRWRPAGQLGARPG